VRRGGVRRGAAALARGGRRRLVSGAVLVATLCGSSNAWSDVVDSAYEAGGEAAVLGHWSKAVTHYERARSLLVSPSASLEYDLGTAYAHTDELGPAIFHLRAALRLAERERVREAARRNLSVTMRRVSLRAETSGARVSTYEDWQSRARRLLQSGAAGWMSLLAGVYLAGLACVRVAAPAAMRRFRSVLLTLGVICACLFVGLGLMRVVALGAAAEAVVSEEHVAVREGAGHHHATAFHVEGGSVVHLKDAAPGWRRVRLDDGLEGWISERALLF